MSKLIVVIGITGTQGSSVAKTFLEVPGWRIRGITRDPSKESAKAFEAKGVEMVKADVNEKDSLVEAFKAGAFDQATNAAAKAAGKVINEYCYEVEIQQGKNIADPAAAPSTMKTLDRFVYSALSDAKRWSKGKYKSVYHFDSKAQVVEYVKRVHPDLDAKMSTVQIGEYAENWRKFESLAPKKQPDGTFILHKPVDGNAPIPMVVANKDTGAFVHALVQVPPGTHLLGYGSLMGWAEYMRIWCSKPGVQGAFEQTTPSEYLRDIPDYLAKEISDGHAYHAEFGWDGGDPVVVHPRDLGVDVPTTSIEEYIESEDWSSIL